MACRTAILGGHMDVCQDCGEALNPSYNSCRDRHCPKCQALDQARWLEKRKKYLLPTHYFHVVLTIPSELHPLARRNPKQIYDLIFAAASQTLLQIGKDHNRLGALVGFTAVLHTWTKDLRYHPHIHCIVTGGGLSLDQQSWVDAGDQYLFPYQVISQVFRGKFLDGLKKLYRQQLIRLTDELAKPDAFQRLLDTLYSKDWVVYAKRPFSGPEQVFSYLGRYTHRVAISNNRILDITDDMVTISTKDGKIAKLSPLVFIKRFLQHVLPKGFFKIRHYGLVSSSHVNTLFPIAKALLDSGADEIQKTIDSDSDCRTDTDNWKDLMFDLTAIDLRLCPTCGSHRLMCVKIPANQISSDHISVHQSRRPP